MAKDQPKDQLKGISEKLWKEPSERNWKSFGAALKKSKAKYYKITFTRGKIKKPEDLEGSYAVLYNAKYEPVAKIPIFMTVGKKGIEGATIYLKGLLVANNK